MTLAERLPPQNIEAEQSVLGSLLIDPDAMVTVGSFLRPEDFYRETHGMVYDAIRTLNERHIAADFVTVVDELERRDQLETVGGASYLSSLINAVPTSVHVEHYARIIERQSTLRRLIAAAGQIAALAYEDQGEVDQVIDKAEQLLFEVSQRRISRELVHIKELIADYYDHVEFMLEHPGESFGLPVGFTDLDRLLGGLQKSDLIIIAARPSMGKSSLAISMAVNSAVKSNAVVALFTLEMSGEQVAQRMLQGRAGIPSDKLRKGNISELEWDHFTKASADLSEVQIFIDDTPSPSPTEIRTKARRLMAEKGLDLIIIDYLQLMQASDRRSENRVQEISYISRALKGVARDLNVPVIALSQLSRAVESRENKMPVLSDLRESGSIEQDADIVMFIYREAMYDENTERGQVTDLRIAKHRNGPTGQVQLYFDPGTTRFSDLQTVPLDDEFAAGDIF
ncbi:MAG: replicative DNA helicase [Chloroflexi bacterium]|nr:replicative DNA helicase [Chloroflexota bacterium]